MVAKESNIKLVMAGLLLGILMASMDNTIVATAMATIVSDLGGLDKFVWVTSAYMVATMAGMPIFGKLSDMYGRKRFYLFGLIVFTIGSILCGTADSITELSIFRAIQGIGGGALMPIAFTIIFDIFPPEKRGKITGLFGAVFGTSSIFGPLLGAVITDTISWHWIFYINVPIGIISLLFITFYYKETAVHSKQKIDWGGAITLVISVVAFMFALELGGKEYPWLSPQIIGLFSCFIFFLILFVFFERKAAEPIIAFHLFKKRLFATSQATAFFYGGVFVIGTVYMPLYIQAVFGGSATNAGLVLMPMMLGSVFGSQFAGFLTTKTSYRNIMILSASFFLTGVILLGSLTVETPRLVVTIFMIILGIGVGHSFSLLSLSTVHNLDAHYRGAANSTNSFFRSLGMTLGITIFGSIQSKILSSKLDGAMNGTNLGSGNEIDPRLLLTGANNESIPLEVMEKIQEAFSLSVSHTFLWAIIPAVMGVVSIVLMPKDRLIPKKAFEKQKTKPVNVNH